MTARVAVGTLALFSACVVLHVLLWRVRALRRIPLLFALFFSPALAGAALALWGEPRRLGFSGEAELAATLLGHVALACAYIQNYPPTVLLPPTLRLLLLVGAREPEGAGAQELGERLNAAALVREIFEPLVEGGLLRRRPGEDRLELTGRGRAFILPFFAFRRLLGLPPGAG